MDILQVTRNNKKIILEIQKYSNSICENIHPIWIKTCTNGFDYCYIATNKKNKICGVITFEITTYINITLLCSKIKGSGVGTELIKIPLEFGEKHKLECKLNSVPTAVDFYIKKGFKKVINNNINNSQTPFYYPYEWLNDKKILNECCVDIKNEYAKYLEKCFETNEKDIKTLDQFGKNL